MNEEIASLQRYLKEVCDYALPKYKELPGVDLYMEQVLKYINGTLESLSIDGEKELTSFMVNNYVKAKMIEEPKKKKYSKDQIGYLMAICLMKSTLSMADLSLLLELDEQVSADKGRLYAFWSSIETSILSETARRATVKVDSTARRYAVESEAELPEADENARNALALLAMRLAIQAQANKLISEAILSTLRGEMHPQPSIDLETTPGGKEIKHEAKAGAKEAKRIAKADKKTKKAARKAAKGDNK